MATILRRQRKNISTTLCLFLLMTAEAMAATPTEQLIVFVQPGASPVDTYFQQHQLPEIKKLAAAMNVELITADAEQGVPPEVTITPLIVYQNYRGRSVYQGRTTTLKRVRNFIRTSRFVPQGATPLVQRNVPVWELQRTRIWAPIKITPVTGMPPENYDHTIFAAESRKAIEEGFKHFRMREEVELGRSDRGFYMDFYPWLSEEGILYLSLALFSQFHCKHPVFEEKKKPLVGPWEQRNSLFRKAGTIMEEALKARIEDPETGDGFDRIDAKVKQVSWNDLGFALPPEPEKKTGTILVHKVVPRHWQLNTSGPDDPPMVQFRFPAPLDQYAGEVTIGNGELSLPDNRRLNRAKGFAEMDPRSVTMGEPDLDKTLRQSIFLDIKNHPVARFVVSAISDDGAPLTYGRLSPASVQGTFTLKGKSIPLTAPMEMEPVLGDDGTPRLLTRGTFQISLDDFGIEGADGPAPANKTLIFDLNFVFRPADGK